MSPSEQCPGVGYPEFSGEQPLTDPQLNQLAEDFALTVLLVFGPYLTQDYDNLSIALRADEDTELELYADYEDEYDDVVILLKVITDTGEVVGDGRESSILESQEFTFFSNGYIQVATSHLIKTQNGAYGKITKRGEQARSSLSDNKVIRKLSRCYDNQKLTTRHQSLIYMALKDLQDNEINSES